MSGRLFAKVDFDAPPEEISDTILAGESEANLETSLAAHQADPHVLMHRPVVDLDISHEYRESSKPGHAHLLLNIDIPWEKHLQWLELSAELGIVEQGWVKAAKARGFACIRKKGVKKTKAQMEKKNYNYGQPKTEKAAFDALFKLATPKMKKKVDTYALPSPF